jgi:YesN/AraC family two-component response regulator
MDYSMVKGLVHFSNVTVSACEPLKRKPVPYYELTFVLEGALYYVINDKQYKVKKNSALFLTPGSYRVRTQGNTPVRYISFNFHINDGVKLPFTTVMENCITSTIKKMLGMYPYITILPTFHSREKIMSILNCILLELLDINDLKCSNEHVMKIYKYILNNLNKKITLDDLSEELHLSKEYISRTFKKETGKTVINYINEQKMFLAKELITNHNMSLASIATQLGYDDYNYFSRIFKKYFSTPPNRLKRNEALNTDTE